jgi:predicted nicotinamide N-methyase
VHPSELIEPLCAVLPDAELEVVELPGTTGLRLALLAESYPQHRLGSADITRLMDEPMYWAFCWAAGQVLAQWITNQPHRVAGRRVLDFGAGSGVVALAAARAGAREVVACDSDPRARAACRHNARLNGVSLKIADAFETVGGDVDLIIAADVLYDRSNRPWLGRFLDRAPEVLLADSRVPDLEDHRYHCIGRQESHTLPDLDESGEFRSVRVYCGRRSPEVEEQES